VLADPQARSYSDAALMPSSEGEVPDFVEIFAERIPPTHGAPRQRALTM
jgi:hypothetical protein